MSKSIGDFRRLRNPISALQTESAAMGTLRNLFTIILSILTVLYVPLGPRADRTFNRKVPFKIIKIRTWGSVHTVWALFSVLVRSRQPLYTPALKLSDGLICVLCSGK